MARLLRQLHAPLVADPALVLLRQLERLLRLVEQLLDAPRLRVDDVGAAAGLVHVVGDLERRAVRLRLLLREGHRLLHQLPLGRMGQDDVEAEARHQRDEALRHRHRLRVARRVRPRDGDLAALEVPAELLADRHQVGQRLERVVDVALHVEDRHGGVLGHLAHVAVALAGHEVVADGDARGRSSTG